MSEIYCFYTYSIGHLSAEFCDLVQKALNTHRKLRVIHVHRLYPENISFYVDIDKPCCLFHTCLALEEEFKNRWIEKYNKGPSDSLWMVPVKGRNPQTGELMEIMAPRPPEMNYFNIWDIEYISDDNKRLIIEVGVSDEDTVHL